MSKTFAGRISLAGALSLMVLFTATSIASGKVLVDGAQSHAVGVHVRVARYKWLIGNTGASLAELADAGALLIPAGLRWQTAQLLFLASAGEHWLGQPRRSEAICWQALEVLAFGRYDRAGGGTSTARARCETPPAR